MKTFRDNVLATDNAFDITGKKNGGKIYYSFIQKRWQEARYIFGYSTYHKPYQYEINVSYHLAAIACDNDNIYIVNPYFFMAGADSDVLPDGVFLFRDFVKDLNDQANEIVLDVMDNVHVKMEKYLSQDDIDKCRLRAREIILKDEDPLKLKVPEDFISKNDAAKILCGDSLEKLVAKKVDKQKTWWIFRKLGIRKVNEILEENIINQDIVSRNELKLLRTMQNVVKEGKIKTIIIEFQVGEKNAKRARIAPTVIIRAIMDNCGKFSEKDFVGSKMKKHLAEELELERTVNVLDIDAVMYADKALYQRNPAITLNKTYEEKYGKYSGNFGEKYKRKHGGEYEGNYERNYTIKYDRKYGGKESEGKEDGENQNGKNYDGENYDGGKDDGKNDGENDE